MSVAAFVAVAPTPAQAPKRGGILRVAEQSDPVGFDTLGKKKAPVYTQLALAYTHNRLLKYDPSGEVVNDLAAGWTSRTRTYVVTLRKGVHFHNKPPVNGRELTSEDIKFTFERMTKSPEARLFPTLKAVTTPDKYTVRFELSRRRSPRLRGQPGRHHDVRLAPKEAGKPTPDGAGDYTSADTVIGTGPFMLEEYREKQRLVFKRNPDYFETRQAVPRRRRALHLFSDNAGSDRRDAHRQAGSDPGRTRRRPAALPGARGPGHPGREVLPHRLFQTSENLVGRVDQKPWSDVRVRRAVSMSIDRAGLAKAMFTEGAELFSGPIPVTSKYFIPLDKLGEVRLPGTATTLPPGAGKLLAADAGYPNGLPGGADHHHRLRPDVHLAHRATEVDGGQARHRGEYRDAGVSGVDLQHLQRKLRGARAHSRLDAR